MTDKSNLIINLREENNIKIERKIEDIKLSIFRENYIDALGNLSDILNVEKLDDDEAIDREINNLIVFTGNRGSGKSSCMYSFAKIVDNISSTDKDIVTLKELVSYEDEGESKNIDFEKIKKTKFVNLKTIDPSLFEGANNVLEIVISNMFFKFKVEIEKQNSNCDDEKKRKLLAQFQKVHKSLKTLNKTKKEIFEEDMLESLISISDSTNIKGDLEKLIKLYSEFMLGNDSKGEHNKLLIRIDDIDLNTKHAYEMVEQIRKYLMLPNVVILMAVKLEQLFEIIKQENIKEFEESLDKEEMDTTQITLITERYLEKLVPVNRRNYMPNKSRINLNTGVTIKCKNDTEKIYSSISTAVESTIYKKTGLAFLTNSDNVNYIIPENLREIKQLLGFLEDMDDVKRTTREKIDSSLEILNIEGFTKGEFEKCLKENKKILMLEYMIKCYVRFYETLEKEKESENKNLEFEISKISKTYVDNFLETSYKTFEEEYNKLISDEKNLKDKGKMDEIDSLIKKLSILEKLKYYKSEFEDVKANSSKKKHNTDYVISKTFLDKFDFYKLNSDKLQSLIEVINGKECINKLTRNLEKFRRYFVENWAYENLESAHQDIVNEFIEAPVHMKNKNLVVQIENEFKIIDEQIKYEKKGGNKNQNTSNEIIEYLKIIDKNNNHVNLSLGDIRGVLKKLNFYYEDSSVKKFIFAVTTIYSLELYSLNFGEKEKYKYRSLIGNGVINNEFTKVLRERQNEVPNMLEEKTKLRQSFDTSYSSMINRRDYDNYEDSVGAILIHFLVSEISKVDRTSDENIIEKYGDRDSNILKGNIFNFMHTTINPIKQIDRFRKVDKNREISNRITENNFKEKDIYIGNLELLNDITQNITKNRNVTFDEYIKTLKVYSYLSETKILHYRESNFLKLYQNHVVNFNYKYLSQIIDISFLSDIIKLFDTVSLSESKSDINKKIVLFETKFESNYKTLDFYESFLTLLLQLKKLTSTTHILFEGYKKVFIHVIYDYLFFSTEYMKNMLTSEVDLIKNLIYNKYLCCFNEPMDMEQKKGAIIDTQTRGIFDNGSKVNENIFSKMKFSNIEYDGKYILANTDFDKIKSIFDNDKISLSVNCIKEDEKGKTDSLHKITKENIEKENAFSINKPIAIGEQIDLLFLFEIKFRVGKYLNQIFSSYYFVTYEVTETNLKFVSCDFKDEKPTMVN